MAHLLPDRDDFVELSFDVFDFVTVEFTPGHGDAVGAAVSGLARTVDVVEHREGEELEELQIIIDQGGLLELYFKLAGAANPDRIGPLDTVNPTVPELRDELETLLEQHLVDELAF